MSYFSKVASLAKQSMGMMSGGAGQVDGRSSHGSLVRVNPQHRIEELFRATCELLEKLAGSVDSKSLEGERKLQQSKVKMYLKEIVCLLQEEGFRWLKRNKTDPDRDVDLNSETPCIDTFLQSRMVQELCNRAVLDNPRGCLPLILTMLTALLKSIPYPLLPHMTVHKPIANLISVAVRYDAMHMNTTAAVVGTEVFNQAEYIAYKKKIEIALIGLLRVLWRKFSENPAILDYFTFEDRRRRASTAGGSPSPMAIVNSSTGTPTSHLTIQTQMDVLNALVALIHKPRVALYAQEALLVALNMCDTRIEKFILIHTQFIEQILDDLCKRFQLALEAANEALSAPVVLYSGSSSSLGAAGLAANRAGNNNNISNVPTGNATGNTPKGALGNSRASFTGSLFSSQGASTTSSLLSPLSKLPSFTTGSSSAVKPPLAPNSSQKVLNSPSVSAAFSFFSKESFYGTPSAGTASQAEPGRREEVEETVAAGKAGSEAKFAPIQTFLRTLRFCVAVAAALRRMTPKQAHSHTGTKQLISHTTPSGAPRTPGTETERVGTYESMVEYYIEHFLEGVLKTALQSRGEGNAVAVNILMVNMLEEMNASEQLWASHTGGSKLSTIVYSSGRPAKSLLHLTTQFLCGSLPAPAPEMETEVSTECDPSLVINKTLFGASPEPKGSSKSHNSSTSTMGASATPPPGQQPQAQVNYTTMLLGRVGSITKMISVSSYLVMGSVLQSAPLSLSLEVLLGLPSLSSIQVPLEVSDVSDSVPSPLSPKSPTTSSSSPSSPKPAEATKSLDDALSSICNALALVAYHSLADDLNPGQTSRALTPVKPSSSTNSGSGKSDSAVTLDLHRYTENASCQILSRLPGKALWSLLSRDTDPDSSALSPALLVSLEAAAGRGGHTGVMEVLSKRLESFLSLKFDEQVALSLLLQRAVCLLSVVVLASQHSPSRIEFGEPDTAVQYLMQIMELLKVIEKLWKEIKGYLQRVQGYSSKVPAMRQVLQATALVEIDNSIRLSILSESPSVESSPAGAHVSLAAVDNSRVSILHRVDADSYKLIEKEPAQARSILESAVLLHELRAEVRSYLFAIRSLRGLMKNAIGVVPPSKTSASHLDASLSPTHASLVGPRESIDDNISDTDVPEEALEDDLCAQAMRQAMHSFGWEVPPYHGVAFNPRTAALAASQPSSYMSLVLLAGAPKGGESIVGSTSAAPSSRNITPSASLSNFSILSPQSAHSGRRMSLMHNLDLRAEEFLAEYQVLEAGLNEIIGSSAEEGG